jgi:hypothetical protein
MSARFGSPANPQGGVHGSILVPPHDELIKPTGAFSSLCSERPKKNPTAVYDPAVSGVQTVHSAVDVILRKSGRGLGNLDVPHLRIIGRRDLVGRAVAIGDHPFHVRLAGTEPDLADEHVFQADGILARDGQIGGTTGRLSGQVDPPRAVVAGRGGFARPLPSLTVTFSPGSAQPQTGIGISR